MGEQLNLYKSRIDSLEEDLSRTKEEKTNLIYDLRRVTNEKER